ncbi:MAG: Hydrogen peroxide-inducible genes activator [Acidimicrobiales bacterium]|nr:MAG: LysR family transcriptional regulator [Actinomycetota bacterium]MBV6509929.1 Hydrogen peroxide-inducible genes activator [Acidimicrobiales bacterium]RIK08580.1 MAG: hypothetical protein DCC48_01160 [Acidobacteriota bacterium]
MDLKQLAALVAVAEHRSFSAAARALHTVQSNVSTHVAHLERELGVTLVDRSAGELTEEGRVVVERARRVQSELEALVSDVAAVHDEISGTVRAGIIGTTARWLSPPLLEAMAASYPDVRLVILDATTTSLLPQLSNGQIDLAVVNTPLDDPEVEVAPLFDEDRLLVVPAGHPLQERDEVSFEELANHELLLPASGTAFREELDRFAAEAGVKLATKAEVDGMRLLASLAFSGFGAAILPASATPGWVGGDWKRIPVPGLPGRSVGLAHRRRGLPSAAERALRDTLQAVVREQAPEQPGIYPVAG